MTSTTDPLEVLRGLDADDIARRLDQLAAEQAALRVLLRAARARQRKRRETAGRSTRPESQPEHTPLVRQPGGRR